MPASPGFIHGHGPAREQFPPNLGQQTSANSLGVVIASDQPAIPVTQGGLSVVFTTRVDYSSTGITTGAWTQLIASTSAAIKKLLIADTSGEVIKIGTGAALSEVDLFHVCRGGWASPVEVSIGSGTRIAIRAVTNNISAGDLIVVGLG